MLNWGGVGLRAAVAVCAAAVMVVAFQGQVYVPPPTGVVQMQDALGSNGIVSLVQCDQTARISGGSSSSVLIAHTAGKTTYICSYAFSVGLVASISAGLVWGTGTNCGSNQVPASPSLLIGLSVTSGQLASLGGGTGSIDSSPTLGVSDFCLVVSGAPATTGIVRYAVI